MDYYLSEVCLGSLLGVDGVCLILMFIMDCNVERLLSEVASTVLSLI